MKKKYILLSVLMAAALLLSGCAMRTVEEMYALPKRSEEYSQLQSAIDAAMTGLNYSAPISGENQQTVQAADLDGDGVEEYLVFAAGSWERPLQVLIFSQEADGTCVLADVVESNGTAFEQVEYVEFDDKAGCELVIGCQVSDQVLRSVSVYSYSGGSIEQLLMVGYAKFLTCDLDENGFSEIMVLRPGEAETLNAVGVLYSSQDGRIHRSAEAELNGTSGQIRRILPGALDGGSPAVFVSSATEAGTIFTDVFTMKDGRLTNITAATQTDINIESLRNFSVYAEDIDDDGVVELPSLLPMHPVSNWRSSEDTYLLRWFSMNQEGREVDKLYTFHYFLGGWYVQLDGGWASRVSVLQGEGMCTFYVWSEDFREAAALFSIYSFTGSSRNEDAGRDGRFVLHRTDSAAFGGKLEQDAYRYGITEDYLKECFRLIRQDRRMG